MFTSNIIYDLTICNEIFILIFKIPHFNTFHFIYNITYSTYLQIPSFISQTVRPTEMVPIQQSCHLHMHVSIVPVRTKCIYPSDDDHKGKKLSIFLIIHFYIYVLY
jgi:hypothetical protein